MCQHDCQTADSRNWNRRCRDKAACALDGEQGSQVLLHGSPSAAAALLLEVALLDQTERRESAYLLHL